MFKQKGGFDVIVGNPPWISINFKDEMLLLTAEIIEYIKNHFPENTKLWIGTVDEKLNDHGYIVPGLGDAGDLAYGRVTQEQKKGVLQKMFLNKEARLKDVKESRLTQFGELLRQKIQQKIIDPSLLGLMTASDETPGMPEYISSIWGIQKRNQVYSLPQGSFVSHQLR